MAIRIRQTPYTRMGANPGPYPMHPDEVLAQLGVIAMAGSQNLPGSLGDNPDPGDGEYTILSYDPGPQDIATAAGRVRQRLKDLVDGGEDIRLFGVGPDFVWSDGSTIEDSAGGAIGSWIFYDTQNCSGNGRWVRGTDGEEVCVSSAGILYHELGHVFLNHPSGTVDEDEQAAVGFENDLRTAEGRVSRDPSNWHESECGCPNGCCIVASVATGSPFSEEVHALRRFRDRTLRRTAIGMKFFDAMFREYYSFSVAVSRILVTSPAAREQVAGWLVRPLIRGLEMAQYHIDHPEDAAALAELVAGDGEADSALPEALTWADVARLLGFAARGLPIEEEVPALDPSLTRVFGLLREKLTGLPHVRWGIIDVLSVYARTQVRIAAGENIATVGKRLCEELDEWAASMPLDYLCEQLSEADWCRDLPVMSVTFFTGPDVRRRFGKRLVNILRQPLGRELFETLGSEGYLNDKQEKT